MVKNPQTLPYSIKLIDFGASREVETLAETEVGTFGFMAPEVEEGLPYNHSVDVYSLGVVIRQILSDFADWEKLSEEEENIKKFIEDYVQERMICKKAELRYSITKVLE